MELCVVEDVEMCQLNVDRGLRRSEREFPLRRGRAGAVIVQRSRTHDDLKRELPKRTDLQSILILGSGPIDIGQAAEFDYSDEQGLCSARCGSVVLEKGVGEFLDLPAADPLDAEAVRLSGLPFVITKV